MARERRVDGGVRWYAAGGRRPIAYSTKATSDLIAMLAEDGHTFASARANVRWDPDAEVVLDAFIARGLGDDLMRDHNIR